MALPIVGGSDGTWGTTLNNFLGGAAGDGTPTIPNNRIPYLSSGNHTSSANLTYDGTTFSLGSASLITADMTFNDNVRATFGTGGDADVYYDATNLVINPMVVGTGFINVLKTNSQIGLRLTNNGTTTRGAVLSLYQNSGTSAADNDLAGQIEVRCDDDTGTQRQIALIQAQFQDVTSTTMDSRWLFAVMNNQSTSGPGTEAQLTSLGVWTDAPSFEELKTYEDYTATEVLGALKTLRVGRYRGKDRPDIIGTERHIGPTADGFYNAFKAGKNPRINIIDTEGGSHPQYGIAAHDMAGVALMALQALLVRVEAIEARI